MGQSCYAIGNPYGYENTLTTGVIFFVIFFFQTIIQPAFYSIFWSNESYRWSVDWGGRSHHQMEVLFEEPFKQMQLLMLVRTDYFPTFYPSNGIHHNCHSFSSVRVMNYLYSTHQPVSPFCYVLIVVQF